jgi:hypothetical protein
MTRPPPIASLTRSVPGFLRRSAAITMVAAVVVVLPAQAAPLRGDVATLHAHVVRHDNHAGAPFAVIDKRRAHLWLFDARGRRLGDAPVLLGSARGDHSVPGIGERPLAQILPHERTTPAGRFVIERGTNLEGKPVLWVDYDAAVSLHAVVTKVAAERRLQRLASKTPADNRISFGCINVPATFFRTRVAPWAAGPLPVVYVLPDASGGVGAWRAALARPPHRTASR